MKGRKAIYTVMVPQNPEGLAELAQQHVMSQKMPIDHCYLDRDKWAHWPGRAPEAHTHLVLHSDDSPEMDSHVKALARLVAQQGNLQAVFATKQGNKGPMSWIIDNKATG